MKVNTHLFMINYQLHDIKIITRHLYCATKCSSAGACLSTTVDSEKNRYVFNMPLNLASNNESS